MLNIPPELARRYTVLLERSGIAAEQRFHFKKWLRYYLDFCHKYGCDPTDRRSFPAFEDKLRTKRQSEGVRPLSDLSDSAGHDTRHNFARPAID